MGGARSPAAASAASAASPTTGAGASRVLIADADGAVRQRLADLFVAGRWLVEMAAEGSSALAAVRASRPAAVVVDLLLPRLDGLAVCRAITHDPALAGTRVVVLTADAQVIARQHLLDTGAFGYLLKPVEPADVLALLRRLGDVVDAS